MMSGVGGLQPGLYINLADEVYHADPALSRTNLVDLLDTPRTYWINSAMNPERPTRAKTEATQYGSAFDMLMFEPEKFKKKYQIVGADDWDGTKEELISYKDYFKIYESIKVLREGASSDADLCLSGGLPQVTIVFDYQGIRFRTRHDYFTPVLSTDFKTTRSLHEGHLKRAFNEYGYDIQNSLYKLSRKRFKEQYRAGEAEVYGNIDPEFFRAFMEAEYNGFIFVFQRSTPPHPYESIMPEDDTDSIGDDRIHKAMEIYHKNLQKFGTKIWPVCEGKTRAFSMIYGFKNN